MGFNLGLAAAAYQGVKDEQRRLRDDAFTKAQNDYTLAKMDEYTSRRGYRDNAAAADDEEVTARRTLLPQKTAVARAKLDADGKVIPLQADADAARLSTEVELAPKRAQVTGGQLNATLADQAAAEKLRPTREATAQTQADTGLVSARTAYDDAQDYRTWSPARRKLQGQRIDEAIAESAVKRGEFQDRVMGQIYESATTGKVDEHGIVDRLNSLSDSSLFPELRGKTVAHLEQTATDMVMKDTAGNVIGSFPIDRMQAAHKKYNQGKVMTLGDGVNAYRQNADGTLEKLTENKKSFNPNSGLVGRAGGASAVQDRFAQALMAEAKAQGKNMTLAEAYRQSSAQLKANPGGWAQKALQADFMYSAERDPAKKQEMEREALDAAKRLANPGASAPGLDSASPSTPQKIKDFIG